MCLFLPRDGRCHRESDEPAIAATRHAGNEARHARAKWSWKSSICREKDGMSEPVRMWDQVTRKGSKSVRWRLGANNNERSRVTQKRERRKKNHVYEKSLIDPHQI